MVQREDSFAEVPPNAVLSLFADDDMRAYEWAIRHPLGVVLGWLASARYVVATPPSMVGELIVQ